MVILSPSVMSDAEGIVPTGGELTLLEAVGKALTASVDATFMRYDEVLVDVTINRASI